LNRCWLDGHRSKEKLRLRADYHSAFAHQLEVGGFQAPAAEKDLPKKFSRRIPNTDTVTHCGIHIPLGISMNTVRNTRVDESEDLTVSECTIASYVVPIAIE
jgi:hypothetical protein